AEVLRKHAAVVDASDLLVDAFTQIHEAGLRVAMPLDEADTKLGGVPARSRLAAGAARGGGGAAGVAIGGIYLPLNDSPDKDTSAIPRAASSELVMTP